MAFSRIVFTVLLVSVSCYANSVPVFIWGDQTTPIKANPLKTTSTEKFGNTFKNANNVEPFTVVFMEQTLSPEDISSKNADGTSPLPYLVQQAKSGHFAYSSAVDSPVLAIDENADPTEVVHINLSEEELPADLPSSNIKYLFINLDDAIEGESRAQMLKRHNDFMHKTFETLKQNYKDLVGVFTGLNPSWVITESHSRVRRQATNETEDLILEGVRLYVDQLVLREGDNVVNLTGVPTSSMSLNETEKTMNTTITFGDRSFVMNFKIKMGYWYFESVTFNTGTANEEILYPTTDRLFALVGFSYRCGQTTVFNNIFTNTTRSLTFNDLQIQPYFTTINDTVQFGNTFDCVGFFSGPIWAGLMVTFILLAITFYGIMMMMDIRTMDRFDDPKGKTITINTSE